MRQHHLATPPATNYRSKCPHGESLSRDFFVFPSAGLGCEEAAERPSVVVGGALSAAVRIVGVVAALSSTGANWVVVTDGAAGGALSAVDGGAETTPTGTAGAGRPLAAWSSSRLDTLATAGAGVDEMAAAAPADDVIGRHRSDAGGAASRGRCCRLIVAPVERSPVRRWGSLS